MKVSWDDSSQSFKKQKKDPHHQPGMIRGSQFIDFHFQTMSSPQALWKFLDRVASIVAVAREEMLTNPGGRSVSKMCFLVINDDEKIG